ncbi:aminotransferase class V-fold PLP-dependent enzyme [Nocardiopsis metallicus]|uniref:aminotransferase class V-fold PLP-dependent enzyme n=1 Tax=Nocardiopsis metallicus TaxID=179819 RepID=UPI00161236FB|nr:aminotransferase class V-fold PLP-dependent enzyme [Nocardiopsis metallicus]
MDVAELREDTPGCAGVVFLDNAGASLVPRQVHRAVVEHLELEMRVGGYEAQDLAEGALTQTTEQVAGLIGAAPGEVVFFEGASQAWSQALGAVELVPGQRVLTTTSEYASNGVGLLRVARLRGVRVQVVPDDAEGVLDLGVLEAELARGDVGLVAINHMPTHSGLVNPAEAVGVLCRRFGVTYLLDACQSVGQWEVDVERIGCDLLSATGRKFVRAPRGTGFLYVRSGARLGEPLLVNHIGGEWSGAQEYRVLPGAAGLASFEHAVAAQIGLGVAARYARWVGMVWARERIGELSGLLRRELGQVAGVRVHDRGRELSGIVTFSLAGRESAWVVKALREQGVRTSLSRPSDQVWTQEAAQGSAPAVVRASVHYYNTETELERVVELVRALA